MIENKDITELSNFKTKAVAKYFFEFNGNVEELKNAILFAKNNNLKILPVSGGTNMLFAFDVWEGLVIKLNDYDVNTNYDITDFVGLRGNIINTKFKFENNILEVSAFESISDVAETLYRKLNCDTWKRFIGLPGKIAGAIVGNAGCFGLETENNFVGCEVLNLTTLELEFLDKDKMEFDYRTSIIKKTGNYLVLKANFDLGTNNEKYAYSGTLDDIIYFRQNKQPRGNTCGSFFKNPSREYPAGKLIEQVGLKGYKKNGAFFSEKHANFLMSDGTATWKDLIDLKNLAIDKVKKQFDIVLENEVRIVKN